MIALKTNPENDRKESFGKKCNGETGLSTSFASVLDILLGVSHDMLEHGSKFHPLVNPVVNSIDFGAGTGK